MNNMYRFVALFLIMLFCSSCSVVFNNRRTAYRQIAQIKEKAVLVRFRSPDKQVAFLQAHNRSEDAQALMTDVEKENQLIFEAFNSEYDFGNYYFVTSDDYEDIRNDNFDQVLVIDKNGDEVSDKSFLDEGFFIISFEGAYETQFYSTDADGKRTPGGGTKRHASLAVLDHEYIQLIKPFPYSSGSYRLLVDPRNRKAIDDNKVQLVDKLNSNLHFFYDNHIKGIEKYKDDEQYYHRQ